MTTHKTSQVLEIHNALQRTDNPDKPYTMPWKLRYAFARNLAKAKEVVTVYEETRRQAFHSLFGQVEKVEPDHPKLPEFEQAVKELLDAEVEVSWHRLASADLESLDGCDLPVTVLSVLLALVD